MLLGVAIKIHLILFFLISRKRLCFFPKHLSIPKESKFDLIKFKDYLIERKLDCIYISREDYEKELPPKREKLIKRKKRKWY